MSHKHHDDDCCYPMSYGYGGGYGMAGYGGGAGASCGTPIGIRWMYALLILIVIVLQFGRRFDRREVAVSSGCCDGGEVAATTRRDGLFDNQLIDNSVLFIIVVFLLVLCAGCWGGFGASGYGGGCGY